MITIKITMNTICLSMSIRIKNKINSILVKELFKVDKKNIIIETNNSYDTHNDYVSKQYNI